MKMRSYYLEVIILLECNILVFSSLNNNNINKRTSNTNDCLVKIEDTEFNINRLKTKHGYEFTSGNNTFILNICATALKCKHADAAACIINDKKEIRIIGLLDKFNFHTKLKYKYKKEAETIINFKCNPHLKVPYIQYDSQNANQKVYKFIFHTSVICMKRPMKCQVQDVETDLYYDITSLYKPNSNWVVKNATNGVINLNICGDLHLTSDTKKNECRYNGTQLCFVDYFGKATNLGVFSTELKLVDNGLSVNFTGGSLCRNISTVVTKLDFICSFKDSGPIMLFYSDCEYNIVWYTPAACPFDISISNDCILGGQNEPLYISGAKEKQLSTNLKIKYNICGVLTGTCNDQKNVSICLLNDNNKEIVLGVGNNTLISRDTDTYMNLIGDICSSNEKINHSVNVQFRCDYTPNKPEVISISKDLCTANLTVFSTKVCKQPNVSAKSCEIPANNSHYYDLTPLSLMNRNYEVTDPDDSSQVYLLNICLPIVSGPNALCTGGSAVCLENKAEPNKYKRFKSLGSYSTSSGLEMQNGKLIMQYVTGVCPVPFSSRADYKSIIEFRCAHEAKIPDIQLTKHDCEYTFIWKTQYACPIARDNNITFDLNKENVGHDNIHDHDNIEKHFTTDKTPETTLVENVEHDIQPPGNLVNDNIHKDADKYSTTEKIPEIKVVENDEHKLQLQSTVQNQSKNSTATISMFVPVEIPNTSGIFLKNCTLRDNFNESNQFNMYGLPRVTEVLSKSGTLYSVNICSQQTKIGCASKRCLTNIHIALDKQLVIVNFTEQTSCHSKSYNSVIFMKCSRVFEQPVVIEEQECSVELEWKNAAACAFLKTESHLKSHSESSAGVIVGIFIATVFLIVCIAIGGRYYLMRKRRHADSTLDLVRCEYSRVKDATKIA